MPAPRSRRFVFDLGWGLAWAAATFASLLAFARPDTEPLDGDEIYWVGSAYYFDLAFGRGEWTHPDWQLLPARENPPVAKYVLGLGLAAAGQSVTSPDLLGSFYLMYERIPGAWGTGTDHAKRAAVVSRISPALREKVRAGMPPPLDSARLGAARRVTIACGVLTGLLLFMLGWQAGGPLGGLLASQLWLLHPIVIHAYNHAHADSIALFFATAAAAVAFHFAKRAASDVGPSRRTQFTTAVGLGALLALACGAKMNSLVVAGLAGLTLIFATRAAWRHHPERGRQTALAAALSFAAALGTFVAINPTIWGDPLGGLLATVQEHRATELIQARFIGGHLVSLPAKAAAVAQLATWGSLPLIGLTLLALGAFVPRRPGLRFSAAWFIAGLLSVTLWIPFGLGRYVLPLILPAALLTGVLMAMFIAAVARRMRKLETTIA